VAVLRVASNSAKSLEIHLSWLHHFLSSIRTTHCVLPPTLTFGRLPWRSPICSSKFRERTFGALVFPAKSGKNAGSIEKLTKLSSTGSPADDRLGTTTALKSAGAPVIGVRTGVSVVWGSGDVIAGRKVEKAKVSLKKRNCRDAMMGAREMWKSDTWRSRRKEIRARFFQASTDLIFHIQVRHSRLLGVACMCFSSYSVSETDGQLQGAPAG